jgi:hypothetical protein
MIKTFESFVEDKNFRYEEEIIDPILNCIKDNQVYLTMTENLPQLAKLGYMYNTLWYAGRVCWGYSGILVDKTKRKNLQDIEEEEYDEEEDYGSCEDNPKYKIEMCEPQNQEIENLIYDAWGQHVSNDGPIYNFFDIIKNGKELTELEKKELKLNKTFEDWVEIKTDPGYKYKSLYPDRRSVANSLLCTLGGGYGFDKNGYIIEEASGADQDRAIYGDWKNAKFAPKIKKVVDKIISNPQVKRTVDEYNKYLQKFQDEKDRRNKAWTDDVDFDIDELKSLLAKLKGQGGKPKEYVKPYSQYYPISSSSSIYLIIDQETKDRLGIKKIHQSYIDAGTEVCKEIIENKDKEREENVEFAYKYLLAQGFKEYEKFVPKEIDKYKLLSYIQDAFLYVTDSMHKSSNYDLGRGEYQLYLNDTKDNQYADNNYVFRCSTIGFDIPEGLSNSIDFIKDSKLKKSFKSAISRIKQNKNIKSVLVHVDNIKKPSLLQCVTINVIANDKYGHSEDKLEDEKRLSDLGFEIGTLYVLLKCKNYILITQKPEPLGKKHPSNKSGLDYFSKVKEIYFYDYSWRKICTVNIDERHFNTIGVTGNTITNKVDPIRKVINEEFNKMKGSDSGYGLGKKEGSKCLYAHDFMVWLKNKGI